jgi:hypothetical protein
VADVFGNVDQAKDCIKQRTFVWFSFCVSNNMDFLSITIKTAIMQCMELKVYRKLLIFRGNSPTEITGF